MNLWRTPKAVLVLGVAPAERSARKSPSWSKCASDAFDLAPTSDQPPLNQPRRVGSTQATPVHMQTKRLCCRFDMPSQNVLVVHRPVRTKPRFIGCSFSAAILCTSRTGVSARCEFQSLTFSTARQVGIPNTQPPVLTLLESREYLGNISAPCYYLVSNSDDFTLIHFIDRGRDESHLSPPTFPPAALSFGFMFSSCLLARESHGGAKVFRWSRQSSGDLPRK